MSLEIDGNDTVGLTRRFDTLVVFLLFHSRPNCSPIFSDPSFSSKIKNFPSRYILSALPDGISRRCLLCENQNDASAAR